MYIYYLTDRLYLADYVTEAFQFYPTSYYKIRSIVLFKDYSMYLLWTQFSEQKLQPCLKVKNYQNPFCKKKLEIINKIIQIKTFGGCHNLLLIYDAPKPSTV